MKQLFIVGSGGFSKQVIEIVEKNNEQKQIYNLVGLVDDDKEKQKSEVLGYKILGTTDFLHEYSKVNKVYGVIAISNTKIRKQLASKLNNVEWINLIHPDAILTKYMKLGKGNVISGGVVINPDCKLGNHCHLNIGTTLGHDVKLSDYVTVMPGSRISGNVHLKRNTLVGTGSTIIQNITINENTMLGAGTVIIKDTERNGLYVGVPGQKIKDLESN
ncbi:acyltransferase [Cerasibacillus quisquiliarum]|uniref:Acyltransferase n=2 Tax=Cerasibacillus quisquiliarum TaxID=227865 RepID=A0A511UW73_9BACI|nr:acyltransferase [Cerasibacillus quisquiliarum]